MDLDDHPDRSQQAIDCLTALSDGSPLLSNSPSSKLISLDKKGTSRTSNAAGSTDLTTPSSFVPRVNIRSGDIISKIEDILQHVVDCIIDEKKELVLHLKPRMRPGNEVLDAASGVIKYSTIMEVRTVRFPGKTTREAWKFGM